MIRYEHQLTNVKVFLTLVPTEKKLTILKWLMTLIKSNAF